MAGPVAPWNQYFYHPPQRAAVLNSASPVLGIHARCHSMCVPHDLQFWGLRACPEGGSLPEPPLPAPPPAPSRGRQGSPRASPQVGVVSAFAQTLRRYTSLNHLAQAARAVLQNTSQINQMLSDLNRVDFANVQVTPPARRRLLPGTSPTGAGMGTHWPSSHPLEKCRDPPILAHSKLGTSPGPTFVLHGNGWG